MPPHRHFLQGVPPFFRKTEYRYFFVVLWFSAAVGYYRTTSLSVQQSRLTANSQMSPTVKSLRRCPEILASAPCCSMGVAGDWASPFPVHRREWMLLPGQHCNSKHCRGAETRTEAMKSTLDRRTCGL